MARKIITCLCEPYRKFVNPLTADVGICRHWLLEKTNPSCKPDFHYEITIFGLSWRKYVVLQDSVKIFFKISLLTEILAKNVKKMQKFCKNWLFWDFDRFLSIFRQWVNQKPQNLVLFYFFLSSSELIWSFTTGHLFINSVRSAPPLSHRPPRPS